MHNPLHARLPFLDGVSVVSHYLVLQRAAVPSSKSPKRLIELVLHLHIHVQFIRWLPSTAAGSMHALTPVSHDACRHPVNNLTSGQPQHRVPGPVGIFALFVSRIRNKTSILPPQRQARPGAEGEEIIIAPAASLCWDETGDGRGSAAACRGPRLRVISHTRTQHTVACFSFGNFRATVRMGKTRPAGNRRLISQFVLLSGLAALGIQLAPRTTGCVPLSLSLPRSRAAGSLQSTVAS